MRQLVRVIEFVLVAVFAVYLSVVVAQVILRYLRLDILYFSEELSRYLLVWSVLIGASVVTAHNAHVRMDIAETLLPSRPRRWLDVASTLVLLAFAGVLTWAGAVFAQRSGTMTAPLLGIKMWIIYSVIPVTAALDAVFLLARLIHLLTNHAPESLPADGEAIDTSL